MFSLTLKTIRAKKARFVSPRVAVILGVAFMAGTLVLTDTIKQTYDDLAGQVYKDTDAVVRSAPRRSRQGTDDPRHRSTPSLLDTVRSASRRRRRRAASARRRVGRRPRRRAARQQPQPRDPDRHGVAGRRPHSTRCTSSTARPRPRPNEIVIDRAVGRQGRLRGRRHHHASSARAVRPSTGSPASRRTRGKDDAAGAQVVAFTPETATHVLGTPGRYDAIDVVAAPGVSQTSSSPNLQTALAQPRRRGHHRRAAISRSTRGERELSSRS